MKQKDQLNNIERRTTHINQELKTSQKHLTSIKSIFGGIKNWWNGDKEKEPPSRQQDEPGTSKLQETMDKQAASRPHPGERLRTDDGRGFYEDDLDNEFMKGAKNNSQTQYFKPVTNSAREERLNQNLGIYET